MEEPRIEETAQAMEEPRAEEAAKSEPSSAREKTKPEMISLRELFSFARTRKSKLCITGAIFFACISGACFPAVAFYFASAFEDLAADATSSGFMVTIRELAYTFMMLGVILLLAMTLQAFLMETAATEMTTKLKTEWFKALLRQDIQYYDIMDVSGEATIITTNANKFRKGVGRKCAEAVQYGITFLGGFGYAFYASWQVTLGVLAIVPFLTASSLFLLKMNTSVTSRANASYAKAGSIVSTSVSSIRTILALNAVDIMIDRFKEATKEAFDGAVSQVGWLGLANGCNLSSMLLCYVIIALFGSWLLYDAVKNDGCDPSGVVDGNDSTCNPGAKEVIGALFGVSFGAAVLPQVSIAIEALTGARVACLPAFAVIQRRVEKDGKKSGQKETVRRGASTLPNYVIDSSSSSGIKPAAVHGRIEFKNVSFQYPTRLENDVFRDFSLSIEAGQTVALVGFSGSGKSTAVQLIERFYDPTAGSITLDGSDLRCLNIKWLRQQLALVQQEPKLFECSIRENIALGAPEATNEQIEAAARMAHAHDFILEFPNGYDTQVGALGEQLLGGQRQRISIARCLVKDPKVLLIDEGTSALDSESKRIVQEAIDELIKQRNMTTLVIAHRLSTIKNADVIAVVNDGNIVESGTHQVLLAKESHYFRLVQAQEKKKPDEAERTPSGSEHGSSVEPSAHDEQVDNSIIAFENVHFEYPSRPNAPVCRGLNLKVRQGETLALVGPSGCGKSTVIQLMECFYRPTEGVVKYKGVDMRDLNVRWLRDELGLVSQQPTLFDCSIEENIRYGLPNATHEQVVEAAKQANAHDFIMEFPDNYATSVGAGSTLVSGGQKQRICIARALVKKPKLLLLDEATSALDSKSEKVVQEALDKIMFDKDQTCVVIAHRLSTIQSADRIAVIEHGKVRELGTHNELMSLSGGRYRRLQDLQSLDAAPSELDRSSSTKKSRKEDDGAKKKEAELIGEDDEMEVDKERAEVNAKRARLLASGDGFYFVAGGLGAFFAGLVFPGWGFLFAYMIEVLYTPVDDCRPGAVESSVEGFTNCEDYWNEIADDMQHRSVKVCYGYLGIIAAAIIGFTLLFWGFGIASERMNKRVRDAAFTSLLRQEVAWYDLRSPGTLTSRLSDDAALLHAFSGEPIRSFVASLSSVLVGVVVSFVYMWPFALLSLAILPFMAFGAEMEMTMYYGKDEGDDEEIDANSPGGIVIESMSNIRTVASLTLEEERVEQYVHALEHENPHPNRTNIAKGGAAGIGQFVQMWGTGMMFWWGGWLLANYSGLYSYRDFLISMFALFFSLYGLTIASQNAVDRDKAKRAAARIFELIDRQSLIDPFSDEGKQHV